MEIGEALQEALISPSTHSGCPRGAIFLGHDTYYTKVVNSDNEWVGIIEFHKEHEGPNDWEWSGGSCPFENSGSATFWTVNSLDPLDLSPSLACSSCSHHGFIHNGRWEPV